MFDDVGSVAADKAVQVENLDSGKHSIILNPLNDRKLRIEIVLVNIKQ